jgi:hypothetical protein
MHSRLELSWRQPLQQGTGACKEDLGTHHRPLEESLRMRTAEPARTPPKIPGRVFGEGDVARQSQCRRVQGCE